MGSGGFWSSSLSFGVILAMHVLVDLLVSFLMSFLVVHVFVGQLVSFSLCILAVRVNLHSLVPFMLSFLVVHVLAGLPASFFGAFRVVPLPLACNGRVFLSCNAWEKGLLIFAFAGQ